MNAVYQSMGVNMIAVLNDVAIQNESSQLQSPRTATVEACMRDIGSLDRSILQLRQYEAQLKRELQRYGISA